MKHSSLILLAGLLTAALSFNGCTPDTTTAPVTNAEPKTSVRRFANSTNATKEPDVIYVPTRQEVVQKMLELAEIRPGDIVYDLGCGDGRIVVAAAKKYGVKAIGVDIDPQRISEARENVRTNNLEHLVTIKEADIFELDFSDATVVTMYLLPDLNVRLMPKLAKLKPGSRIVSNDFDMQGAKPKQVVELGPTDNGDQRTIYKWVVPWEPE